MTVNGLFEDPRLEKLNQALAKRHIASLALVPLSVQVDSSSSGISRPRRWRP
jgi:hypothetical protein